ncbi:roadblock/LC7 domain-containing protein [Deinococcus maricopensis]|uniref:Roadblock/LC7 family protein n=1 Tax=Deinococcus maricopensis (strain DSM 21211 / LMG 22137 / NRRL B-23946 / LB-34) TaxID=709986 RepID=E8U5H4_DEIML|nr:roadblock/LC7 domain-containing protein [Deinococcus maricopensis]ADV66313.1 Roadblock/LC7 family protein [Deinococcus maricopensis DSM 21211]
MPNAVFSYVAESLSGVVSERAADTMLRSALRDFRLSPDNVTASEMQRVLVGPLLDQLSAVMPRERARSELRRLSGQLQQQHPKAPTLFDVPAQLQWDDLTRGDTAESEDTVDFSSDDFSTDDFEFEDPELAFVAPSARLYALGTASGQDDLLADLARQPGVQGVILCTRAGQVVKARAPRGAQQLGAVVAATALLFQGRAFRIMCADLGEQTVCMRPIGEYFVALLAGGQVNMGRLIAELQQIREAA